MATKAQIERMLRKLDEMHPAKFYRRVDEMQVGIGAVLCLLWETKETVTAGKISEVLKVSTARVAVLLRKMEAKGLIRKERSPEDGRVTVVKLTKSGEETIAKMQEEVHRQMGLVIDTVGEERLLEYFEIAGEIRKTMKPPEAHF